jgi:hypothetical protein
LVTVDTSQEGPAAAIGSTNIACSCHLPAYPQGNGALCDLGLWCITTNL